MSSLDLRVLVLERQRRTMQDDLDTVEGEVDAIQGAIAGGVVHGSGLVNRLAYWNATTALTADTLLAYNPAQHWLGIGNATPTAPLTFSNALGPKIDIYNTGTSRYGIGLQSSQMQIYADPGGDVRIGHMDAAGTTFTSKLQVAPTYVYSNVPMGALWGTVAGYELTTNRLYAAGTSYIALLGVQVVSDASYAIMTNGIHCNTYSRFESNIDVAGYGMMTGVGLAGYNPAIGYAIYSGPSWSYFAERVGIKIANPEYDLHVYGTASLGNTFVNNLLGIGYAPNASYNLYTGSARFLGGVYGDVGFDMATLNVRAGGYWAGPAGIGRVSAAGWSLCVYNMYADAQVQAENFYARTNVTAVGALYCGATYGVQPQSYATDGSTFAYQNALILNPNWGLVYLQSWHQYGSWAGIRFVGGSSANIIDFRVSGGNAYMTAGGWIDAPSDRRLKRNVMSIEAPLERLAKLHGVHYERTDLRAADGFPAPNPHEYGLIAQDVAEALPDAAFEHDYAGRGTLWNYYDRAVLALLVASVNALRARVEALEA